MSARLILSADACQDREAWLAERRKGITASEIAVILGISPFDSPFNLYYKKRGEISEDFDNTAMSLGRHLEPWIADRWAEDHPEFHLEEGGLWASGDRSWQLCTPDRRLYDDVCRCGASGDVLCSCVVGVDEEPVALLEIKTSGTYDGWGEDGTDEIPPYYRAQVLWQLDVMGLETAHVTCLFLGTRQRRDYVIAYDPGDVALMRTAAQVFLEDIERGTPPPIDHSPATTAALRELYPLDEDADAEINGDLAQDYRFAKLALDDARDHYDLLTNQVRAVMGEAKTATCDGAKVAIRSVYERSGVDAKRLRAEHPDAFAACRTTSTVDKITPARAKKD